MRKLNYLLNDFKKKNNNQELHYLHVLNEQQKLYVKFSFWIEITSSEYLNLLQNKKKSSQERMQWGEILIEFQLASSQLQQGETCFSIINFVSFDNVFTAFYIEPRTLIDLLLMSKSSKVSSAFLSNQIFN